MPMIAGTNLTPKQARGLKVFLIIAVVFAIIFAGSCAMCVNAVLS